MTIGKIGPFGCLLDNEQTGNSVPSQEILAVCRIDEWLRRMMFYQVESMKYELASGLH
jgi:hypothetical protein